MLIKVLCSVSDIIMGPKKAKTRHSSGSCFGPSADLPDSGDLFTVRDVLAAFEREVELSAGVSTNSIATRLEVKVREKWKQSNPDLVLMEQKVVIQKISRLYDSAVKVNRKQLTKVKTENFFEKLDKLFDILVCQCKFISCGEVRCTEAECHGAHLHCSCPREFKIPEIEWNFIKDQREKIGQHGLMQMGAPDIKEAKRQKKLRERKERKMKTLETRALGEKENQVEDYDDTIVEMEDISTVDNDDKDEDFVAEQIGVERTHNQNRNNIENFISELERYGISDRAGAALLNAHNRDLGIITDGKDKDAVDKFKIRRARAAYRLKVKARMKTKVDGTGGLTCLGVDGKRDKKTRKRVVQIINGEEVDKNVVETEEHLAYTMEPSGEYLCHSTVELGTGRGLANDFKDVLADHNSIETVEAVVADGTNTNTGWKEGFIAHVERDLKRNLIWLICLAHGNELPFRHLFCHCDGGHGTSGPDSFMGPIGQECKGKIHLIDVVAFTPIPTSVPDMDDGVWTDLSRDQKLLYRYCKAIAAGHVPANLAQQVAGPINHSRWLTLAIRLMTLYTRKQRPSHGLKLIVTYIVQVYCPVWFMIKSKWKFTYGPLHLFSMMKLINTQSKEVQSVVKSVVQRNAFYAEPGVMVCSMLESEEESIRRFAVNTIREHREKPLKISKSKVLQGVRKHTIPVLRWNATSWDQIIDWSKSEFHEPFILSKLDIAKIEECYASPFTFPKYPVHSQSVERAVKLVTEASFKVAGEERRHTSILSVISSRKSRKAFDTKKDYAVSEVE